MDHYSPITPGAFIYDLGPDYYEFSRKLTQQELTTLMLHSADKSIRQMGLDRDRDRLIQRTED